MVKMKNIKHEGDFVTLEGYIKDDNNKHFTMKIYLKDDSKSECSIGWNYFTQNACIKIFRVLAREGKLPSELTFMSH